MKHENVNSIKRANLQVVAVVGPTATGKTKKALELAQKAMANNKYAGVDLISVDSRQVYQGLEVITGADVPDEFKQAESAQYKYSFFTNISKTIRIFGISILNLSEEWSVAHFRQMARGIIVKSLAENRLVILVGGTGLYHRHLFSDDPLLAVPPNPILRASLEKLSIDSLQKRLEKINSEKLAQMNVSDRVNKRRLMRAIEVASATFEFAPGSVQHDKEIHLSNIQVKQIFLTLPLSEIEEKITHRVHERFAGGAIEEVKRLLNLSLPPSAPVLSTLGVPEISQYLQEKITAKQCQSLWALHEYQYAKRQLTWWKNSSSDILSLAV